MFRNGHVTFSANWRALISAQSKITINYYLYYQILD